MCARGGFVLDFSWKDGQLQQVQLISKAGGLCKVQYHNKTVNFAAKKGKTYRLDGALKLL